jgi:tellurite resistance protein TerC
VLFWGILGALVLRGLMIAAGAALFGLVWWMTFVFGALLLITAVKFLVVRHDNLTPYDNLLVRVMRRHFLVTDDFHGTRFFAEIDGARIATPLVVALLVVETSGAVFAVNSIPAVFAVTRDPFLVYTSNVFAVLGLRSLYFALAGTIAHLRYLKTSLAFLLAFVGVKMLLHHHHPIPAPASLAVIGGILFVGIAASVLTGGRDTGGLASPFGPEIEQLMEVGRRQLRRIAILIGGSTVLVIGIAMIVLPGPAIIVIPMGLGILALEFVWARRWLVGLRRAFRRIPFLRRLDDRQRKLRGKLTGKG